MTGKVHYERVSLADIDSSSESDDYGDLFASERGRIGKGRPKGPTENNYNNYNNYKHSSKTIVETSGPCYI